MTEPLDRRDATVLLGWAALAVVLHLQFVVGDSRPAVDLGHTWSGVVRAVGALERGGPVMRHLDGPWHAIVAGVLYLWRDRLAFGALEGLLFLPLVVGLGLAGRVAGGRPGAHLAAAMPVALPLFPIAARTHWIHHPEAAFASLALGIAAAAPVAVLPGVGLAGVLVLLAPVRPSATVWALVPAALWLWRARATPRAAAPLLIPALVAILLVGPGLAGYFALRVGNRAATAAAVGDWVAVVPIQTWLLPGLVLLALAALGAGRRSPVWFAAAAWGLGGVSVLTLSGAGPDNVPTAFVGLGVLAAAGAARIPARWWPLGGVFLVGPATQLVPALGLAAPLTGWFAEDVPLNWLVPRADGITAQALAAPVRGSGRVRVLSRRGWVHPSWEDDGSLGWFLAGIEGIEVLPAPMWRGQPVDVVVDTRCAGPTPEARLRFPGVDERFEAAWAGRVVVAEARGNGCVWTFAR